MTRATPRGADGPERWTLNVLGAVDLTGSGEAPTAVLAQPKRLALLVYLLLARPGSFQRRDHLLAVFWPASAPDRARANLRQAVRFLRKSLGEELVVGRGDGELGLTAGIVSCDALAFRAASERRDFHRALELYAGELLPGLNVSGAVDFDRWLDRERRELREMARDAAAELARGAERQGDLDGAVGFLRQALELDPLAEPLARQLMASLDALGRRSEALDAFESLRSRLQDDLGLDPSPETEGLAAGLRGGPAAHPAGSPPGPQGSPPLTPSRVLVSTFENRTGSKEYEVFGSIAADWISQSLAQIPELSVVPPLLARASEAGEEAEDAARNESAQVPDYAYQVGAGTVVSGALEATGEGLRYRVRLVDAVHQQMIPGPAPVPLSPDAPTEGLVELGTSIAACLAPVLTERPVHAQKAGRPPSFAAYRAYLEGLDHFIRGDWRAALEEFRVSWAEEERYALPRIVSAIAHWNLTELPEAREVASAAASLRGTVGKFEQGALDMVLAWLEGDWRSAYNGARRQAESAPGSLASFQVAEEARRLGRPRESRQILAALDPEAGELDGWIFYWIELCTACHLSGDHEAEFAAARRARGLHPGHPAAALLEARALAALGGLDELEVMAHTLLAQPAGPSPSPGALLRRVALELGAHGQDAAVTRFLDLALTWWDEQGDETNAASLQRRERALALYQRGRLDEAREIFRALFGDLQESSVQSLDDHHGHLQGHLDAGALAVIALRQGDEGSATRLRHYLEDLDAPFLYGAPQLWLARLAAVAENRDRAVSHLRRALVDGLPFQISLHTFPEFATLRDHPGFRGVLSAKG